MIHWSQNKDYLVVYHGTHIRNLADIFKNGIKNKDPITGMVSVAIGDRGEQVSRAYAGMAGVKGAGGEHNFRQLGQKAVSVPHKDRAVVVAHLPMDWVNQHVDRTFSGNSEAVKERLRSPEAHDAYVKTSNKDKKSGEDTSGRETMELRFSSPIPHEYIQKDNNEKTKYVTGESKEQPMKTFKEFIEIVAEEVPTVSTDGVAKFDPLLSSVQRRTNILDVIRKFLHNAKLRPLATDRDPNSQNDEMARSARTAGDGSVRGT